MNEISLIGPILGLGSGLTLCVALLSLRRRVEIRQDKARGTLVTNYERWVRGLRELIDDREERLEDLRASLAGTDMETAWGALEDLSKGQERLRALLKRQLRGNHRTALDVQGLMRELLAQDDLLIRVLLEPPVSNEQDSETREVIEQIRRKMARVEREALEVEGALENERVEAERRFAEMVPARALEEALSLLDALESDLQALERTVLDPEGQLRMGFDDEEIKRFERRLRVIAEDLASTTTDLHDASDERGIHSTGHRLRLKRIERGMLRRFIDAHHLTHERDHLEREVNRLALWKQDASVMIADFERIEAANTDLRLQLARTRQRLQETKQGNPVAENSLDQTPEDASGTPSAR